MENSGSPALTPKSYADSEAVKSPAVVLSGALRRGALRRRGGGALLRLLLAVQRGEVDRVDHQRREAAVARRVGEDRAREREQMPRRLDHQQRLRLLLVQS